MSKSLRLFGYIFAGIGGFLMAIALAGIISDQNSAAKAIKAEGTVVGLRAMSGGSGGTTYAPIVAWTDRNGTAHRLVSSAGSSDPFDRGETVTVLYDPEAPGRARIDTFGQRFTGILIFGGIGVVFCAIGLPLLYFYWRRQFTIARLKRDGERIEADFIRCDVDIGTVVNGRNPYRVHAQGRHPKTGRLASFVSEPIWLDLTSTLEGRKIPVLVNRKRYRDHYIVLDEWVSDEERD